MKKHIYISVILIFMLCFGLVSVFAEGVEYDFSGIYFEAGDRIDVNKNINGTAFVFGSDITVTSRVEGDLFVFGRNVNYTGNINGNVFIFGENVTVNGDVDKDIFVFGRSVKMEKKNRLDRDSVVFAETADIDGKIDRNLTIFAASATMGAVVGGNLDCKVDTLKITETAEIINKTTYTASEFIISEKAKVNEINENKIDKKDTNKNVLQEMLFEILLTAGSVFLIGLFIAFLAPLFNKRISNSLNKNLTRTGLTGFISLILLPVAAIIIAVTVIGIGIGFTLIALYLLALYLSFAIFCIALTNLIVEKNNIKPIHKNIWFFPITAAVLKALTLIPYLGGFIILITLIAGLGLFMSFIFKEKEVSKTLETENV